MSNLKAGEATLQKLLNTSRQFIVPIFQRNFSWEKKTVSATLGGYQAGRQFFAGTDAFYRLDCIYRHGNTGGTAAAADAH